MTQFKFEKWIPRFTTSGSDCIHLNKKNISIGRRAYEIMGKPKIVDIYFDKENKAIQFVKSETGRKISPQLGMSSTLSKIMPLGRYAYTNDNIFVLDKIKF